MRINSPKANGKQGHSLESCFSFQLNDMQVFCITLYLLHIKMALGFTNHIRIFPNGTTYEGAFEHNKPSNEGKWSFKNGNVLSGRYNQQIIPNEDDVCYILLSDLNSFYIITCHYSHNFKYINNCHYII